MDIYSASRSIIQNKSIGIEIRNSKLNINPKIPSYYNK